MTVTYSILRADGTLEKRQSIPVVYMGVTYIPAPCIGGAEGQLYWLSGQSVTLKAPYDTRQGHPGHRTGYGILPEGTRIKLHRMGDEHSAAIWEVEVPIGTRTVECSLKRARTLSRSPETASVRWGERCLVTQYRY